MKKSSMAALLLVLLLIIGTVPTAQAAQRVQVTLPSFKVTLNGSEISGKHSQYPLIVYKDITYFPMTYYYARFLGLSTEWADNTLTISKSSGDLAYEDWYSQGSANRGSCTAAVADIKILVNGTQIVNSREKYPLLSFRDVTYFPLTWRFAVEEFGWSYAYDDQNGLRITSTGSAVPPAQPETGSWSQSLPKYDTKLITVNGIQAEVGRIGDGKAQSPHSGMDPRYIIMGDTTVVYPVSTFDEGCTVTYQKGTAAQASFSLEGTLTGGDYFFGDQADENGYMDPHSDVFPYIMDGILYLPCVRQSNGEKANLMLRIDLAGGTILGMDPLPLLAVKGK